MQLDSNFDVDISQCNSFRNMHYLIQKRGAANCKNHEVTEEKFKR